MLDLQSHFSSLYKTTYRECECKATTIEEWKSWQGRTYEKLREALGITGMESDLADYTVRAEKKASEDCGGFIREEWRFFPEPTVETSFYLLLPKSQARPVPLVLTPHGHNHPHIYAGIAKTEDEKKSMAEGERDIAVQAVMQGYIAIAPTTRGFGDTRTANDQKENKLSSCRTQLMHGLLVGRTPIGERVWDMSRLIDWASDNLPIDKKRIAITGNSGGGTVSLFAAACERRIAVAVPSCYFCTFEGSIGTIHHCDCNYIPGVMRLGEMYDMAGLIAPRPMQAIAGKTDPIFPIEHVQKSFEKVKKIYTVAGVPENCSLYVGEGGHRYYKAGSWNFIAEQFKKID